MRTKTAAFAGNDINLKVLDCVKAAQVLAEKAFGTLRLVDFRLIIQEVVDLLRQQPSFTSKIHLDNRLGESPIWIEADENLLKQVFLNLLSNAVEFTPEKGRIQILTKNGPEKRGRRSIRIEIRDSGAGVPQSNIDKIFDPYFTTKHKSDMHDGTGLGLFIAHQNIQDHGGTIEVKSKVNEGTTFVLTIPAQPPTALSKGGK